VALDNLDKRMSLIGLGSPVPRVLPFPDADIDAEDRFFLLYLCSYFGTTVPVSLTLVARSLSLTLNALSRALTLSARSIGMTLTARSMAMTLNTRSTAFTLPARGD
jgi:hypothetical protein